MRTGGRITGFIDVCFNIIFRTRQKRRPNLPQLRKTMTDHFRNEWTIVAYNLIDDRSQFVISLSWQSWLNFSVHSTPVDCLVLFTVRHRTVCYSWIKLLQNNQTSANRSLLRYTTVMSRNRIRPGFTGTVPVLWALKSCHGVPHNSVRDIKCPGFFPGRKIRRLWQCIRTFWFSWSGKKHLQEDSHQAAAIGRNEWEREEGVRLVIVGFGLRRGMWRNGYVKGIECDCE